MLAIETILAAVCNECEVSRDVLCSASRTTHIVRARQMACVMLHEARPDLSLAAIGRIIGGRDVSTVIHAIRRVAELARTSPAVAKRLADIRERLGVTPPAATPVVVRAASWQDWWAVQGMDYKAVSA